MKLTLIVLFMFMSLSAGAQQFNPKEKALLTKCNEMLETYKKNCTSRLYDGGLEFKGCNRSITTNPEDGDTSNATVVIQFKNFAAGKIIPAHKECQVTTTIPNPSGMENKWIQDVYSSLGTNSSFRREPAGSERYAITGTDSKELLMTRQTGTDEWSAQYGGRKVKTGVNDDERDSYIAGKLVKFDVEIPPPTAKEFHFTEGNVPTEE